MAEAKQTLKKVAKLKDNSLTAFNAKMTLEVYKEQRLS